MKLINFLIFMGHVCVCFCLCVFCCFCSVAQSCPTLCNPHGRQTAARKSFLSFTISWSLLNLMSIESVMPSNYLPSVVPFSSCPQSFPASGSFQMSQLFASGGQNISFNMSPSNEHPGLISLRMDWLDLLAVQGSLKSLLQHHSSKASILRHSAFFMVQLAHPYMTTGKTIAFD